MSSLESELSDAREYPDVNSWLGRIGVQRRYICRYGEDHAVMRGHLSPRYSRRKLGAVGAVLLVVGVSWWMLAGGDRGTTIAVVVTCAAALLTLYVAAFGVPWEPGTPDHAKLVAIARDLAREIGEREAEQQQRLLADTGLARPADIGFRQAELVYWRSDGGDNQGSLKDIMAFYDGLGYGRLVILGRAGAGKTVLASSLLIELIGGLSVDDPPSGASLIIPVFLSLSSFDPPGDLDRAQPAEVSRYLDAWIIHNLTNVYGVEKSRIARALVDKGWILPILDGLDEMDFSGQKPRRAAAVIRALNHPVGTQPRRVVITCRADRYKQLARSNALPGQQPVLQDATAIRIQPLTPDQIKKYLTYRFPDSARPDCIQSRWQPVVRNITGPKPTALAATLSSPLHLFLAVTAYHDPTSDPAWLTKRPADLERDLLVQFIPAIVGQYPKSDGTRYNSADVVLWLTTLAEYLHTCEERHAGSGSDIEVNELWKVAGARSRRLSSAIQSMLTGLPFFVIGGSGLVHSTTHLSVLANGAFLAAGMCGAFVTFLGANFLPTKLTRTDLSSLLSQAGRRGLVRKIGFWLMLGVAFGILFGIGIWIQFRALSGFSFGLLWGVAGGITAALLAEIERRPTAINRPSQLVRQGAIHDATTLIFVGLAAGLVTGFAAWLGSPISHHGYVSGFIVGFLFGVGFGMALLSRSPWLRYVLGTHILARHHKLPPRLSRFLDWSYAAGLLRLSGIYIQFRHRELQAYLVSSQLTSTENSTHGSGASAATGALH